MAKLSPDQLQTVTLWAEDGATLNDIQRRLRDELGITLTYLDARLLMLDIGVRIKDKPRPPEPVAEAPGKPEDPDLDEPAQDDLTLGASPPAAGGKVSVSVDQIAIPGALVSGKVTFSDAKTASWYVDQMGRLGMKAPEPGYTPPQADVAEFQNQLDRVLMQQGF